MRQGPDDLRAFSFLETPMAEALCEWGSNGIDALRSRARVCVIVDVLSFSTAVDVATARGASVIPFVTGDHDGAARVARAAGALLAGRRGDGFSLSPASLRGMAPGARLVLPSPNGSRLSLMCGSAIVLAGCLRKARAIAEAALRLAKGGDIAVIPAGERWRSDDSLRPAIEDWIGAGAILDALSLQLTPEARVARDAFRSARETLEETIRSSLSGRELVERGFACDVDIAVEYNASACAPLLRDEAFSAY
jgi:2-phosphosulfolactate phosphatase